MRHAGGGALRRQRRRRAFEAFRAEVERRGISPAAALRNVCTRGRHEGPVVFVYPDDVWYTRVRPEDVYVIVERRLALAREVSTSAS